MTDVEHAKQDVVDVQRNTGKELECMRTMIEEREREVIVYRYEHLISLITTEP